MNADTAFEEHTDLVRALQRADSPDRAWFDNYHARLGIHPLSTDPSSLFAVGDPTVITDQARTGHGVRTSVIVGFTPTPPAGPEDDQTAGVIDPSMLRPSAQPADEVPAQLAFPREVLTTYAVSALAAAPTLYVTADMVTVIEHAASALDDTDLMPYSPRFPSGFAVLARPLRLPYGDGTDQVIHAFAWSTLGEVLTPFGQAGHAGLAWQFVDRAQAPGDPGATSVDRYYPSRRARQDAPHLALNVVDEYVTGAPVGRTVQTPADLQASREQILAAFDDVDSLPPAPTPMPTNAMGRFQPYLAALLLLIDQQITRARTAPASDHARKRASRTGRSHDTVTVVDLAPREHDTASDETGGGEPGSRYSTRQLVGGHWKWQPYGPGRNLRRRIYVANYVRGPQDAPLVIKPRVHRL
jgi:hypothetical protein